MSEQPIETQLRDALRRLTYATVIIYLALVAVFFLGWRDAGNKRDDLQRLAASTNRALCTFRGDLEGRVQTSKDFLNLHPNGIPGISAATIAQGIDNQQRTIDALSNLDC